MQTLVQQRKQLINSTPGTFFLLILGGIGAIFSLNAGLYLFSIVLFVIFLRLLTNKDAPPVLFFSFFFQWLFFATQLLDGLFKGKDVQHLDKFSGSRDDIIFIGLISISVFFLGIYLVVRELPKTSYGSFVKFFHAFRLGRLFALYVMIDLFFVFAGVFIWAIPGIIQPLFVLTLFRWSLFFLLFNSVFAQNRMKGMLLLVILMNFGFGFFSFFSSFKDVIYFSFIAYWVFFFRSSTPSRVLLAFLLVVTFLLGAVWTAIKEDYRAFLNRGTDVQVVLVSKEEAYGKLVDLIANVNADKFDQGLEQLVDRISWIGAFDGVYNYVPKKRPHENGKLWSTALLRPFMPRLLFTNKAPLEDSKELNYYSGLGVEEENTSISLSMVAGSYVDFGKWGMHLPLFLFGLFCGWVIKKAIQWGKHPIIGVALTMPSIYCFHIAEESMNRIISLMILYFLVLWFIQRFLLKNFIAYIKK